MEGTQVIETPIGYLRIKATDLGLRSITLLKDKPEQNQEPNNQHTKQAANELLEYFAGKRIDFQTFPKQLAGIVRLAVFQETSSDKPICPAG